MYLWQTRLRVHVSLAECTSGVFDDLLINAVILCSLVCFICFQLFMPSVQRKVHMINEYDQSRKVLLFRSALFSSFFHSLAYFTDL